VSFTFSLFSLGDRVPECESNSIQYSIREFTSLDFPVYMYDGEGKHKVMTMNEVSFFSYECRYLLMDGIVASGIFWSWSA
jgi:hypothetical protein